MYDWAKRTYLLHWRKIGLLQPYLKDLDQELLKHSSLSCLGKNGPNH